MTLSVIIVNWNSGPLLRRCLDALAAATARAQAADYTAHRPEYAVCVVDNASTDDSIARARGSQQAFTLEALPENVGFARANNRALRTARSDLVLLLNPDTEPRPGSLAALVDFFAGHPRAGVVGLKLLNPDGTRQPSVRRFPTTLVLALLLTRLARLFPRLPAVRRYLMEGFTGQADTPVDQVMGACFAIRRTVLERVGLLDEGFWIWFEEVDYCRRVRNAGYEVWFTPTGAVVHHRATAFRQRSALWRSWQFSRSALRYAWKHRGLVSAAALCLLVPVGLATAGAALILSRTDRSSLGGNA